MLMEQFLTGVPNEVMHWLKDQKPKTVDEMARLADQYYALRKPAVNEQNDTVLAFGRETSRKWPSSKPSGPVPRQFPKSDGVKPDGVKSIMKCWFCKSPGHKMADCRKRINAEKSNSSVKHDCLLTANTNTTTESDVLPIHPLFKPYCKIGNIVRNDGTKVSIKVLRDTGALQSVLKRSAVQESDFVDTGEIRLLKGIASQVVEVPLVEVHLQTDECDMPVLCGLVSELPEGVDFLL